MISGHQHENSREEAQERAFLCEQTAQKELKDATIATWMFLIPFAALLGFLSYYTGGLLIQLYPFMGIGNFGFAFGLHSLLAWQVELSVQHVWKCSIRGIAAFATFVIGLLCYLGYLAYERASFFMADGDDPDAAWRKAIGWFAAEALIPIAGGAILALLLVRQTGDKLNWKATQKNREVCEVSKGNEGEVFDRSIAEAMKIKHDVERRTPGAKRELTRLDKLIAHLEYYHPRQDDGDENETPMHLPLGRGVGTSLKRVPVSSNYRNK